MTLHEAETKLTEINNSIAELLQERENVLKEWSNAFYTENPDGITCIAEGIGILFMQKPWKLESVREKLQITSGVLHRSANLFADLHF